MAFHNAIFRNRSGSNGAVEADFPRITELPEDDEEQPVPQVMASHADTHSGNVDGHVSDTSSESSDFAEETLYDVIGVDKHATRHEIKKAFKAQIQITKDILATAESAVARNNAIVRALQLKAGYKILRDAAERAAYDASLPEGEKVERDESPKDVPSRVIPENAEPRREQSQAVGRPLIQEVAKHSKHSIDTRLPVTADSSGSAAQPVEVNHISGSANLHHTSGELNPLSIMALASGQSAVPLHQRSAVELPSRLPVTAEVSSVHNTAVSSALVRRPPPAPTQTSMTQAGQASAASTALVRRPDSSGALEQFRHSRNLSRDLTIAAERNDAGSAGWSFGGDFTLKGYGLRVSTVNRVIEYDSSGNQAYGREESRMLERDNTGRTRAQESIREMQGTSGQVSEAMQQLRSQGLGLLQSNPAALQPYGGFYSKRRY